MSLMLNSLRPARIVSDSMRPTLFGGEEGEPLTEWVLVHYDRSLEPERFDLVVARPVGGRAWDASASAQEPSTR